TVYDDKGRQARTVRLVGVRVDLVGTETVLAVSGTELWHTQTVYDARGRVSEAVAADGQVTDYEYDSLDRRTATIGAPVVSGGQAVRLRTETAYDGQGRVQVQTTNLIQRADGSVDRSQAQPTSYSYDAYGNVQTTTFAD